MEILKPEKEKAEKENVKVKTVHFVFESFLSAMNSFQSQ